MTRWSLSPFFPSWQGRRGPWRMPTDRGPRSAIVVGANAAPAGRWPLLFGYRDAENMADVLSTVGGFRREDVAILKAPIQTRAFATSTKRRRLFSTPRRWIM